MVPLKTYSLNAIAVVHGKFRVVLGLNSFVDDTIDDTQSVEVELNAILGAVGNLKVLLIEVIEELPVLELSRMEYELERQSTYGRAIMSERSQ